ncbi:MAG TPA: KUP/HAK/KT family potassium transporter, partial [Acidimicrobiales bacterium]|nr:KUP/HAK/KT family potassium transporter [Acidimicrobiales bacterium]
GIVYGDIGTSPLYAVQTVFSLDGGRIKPTTDDVLGIVSAVLWTLTVIVSAKYVAVVIRADNSGEGGVLALAALVRRALGSRARASWFIAVIGLVGACLFYGDSVITPAISVLSSVQGLELPDPGIAPLVVPISAVVLAGLFVIQPRGTARVGWLFGPIMVAWFVVIGAAGVGGIAERPAVVEALSPTYAVAFAAGHPALAFVAAGAVVLAVTGAEALYADVGHFGKAPIRLAWFALVFPALILDYLGQAALLLRHPADKTNPFFLLMPSWARLPSVLLATAATIIASQAVISGAYSMTRQAGQLGFLPPMTVKQTSQREAGQIYMPAVNWALFVAVLALVLTFRSSARLANAYGIAVTGTFLTTTLMLVILARIEWHWPMWRLVSIGVVFGALELAFFAGNVVKVVDGGYVPLGIGAVLFVVMTTWNRGRELVVARRLEAEGSLADFLADLSTPDVVRVPGTAIFTHASDQTVPMALRVMLDRTGVLHENVVIVSARAQRVAHVPPDEQLRPTHPELAAEGVRHLHLDYGFSDHPDIPAALARAARTPGLDLGGADLDDATYVVSHATLSRGGRGGMAGWRKRLFIALAHNATDPSRTFGLPSHQTVLMGIEIELGPSAPATATPTTP